MLLLFICLLYERMSVQDHILTDFGNGCGGYFKFNIDHKLKHSSYQTFSNNIINNHVISCSLSALFVIQVMKKRSMKYCYAMILFVKSNVFTMECIIAQLLINMHLSIFSPISQSICILMYYYTYSPINSIKWYSIVLQYNYTCNTIIFTKVMDVVRNYGIHNDKKDTWYGYVICLCFCFIFSDFVSLFLSHLNF